MNDAEEAAALTQPITVEPQSWNKPHIRLFRTFPATVWRGGEVVQADAGEVVSVNFLFKTCGLSLGRRVFDFVEWPAEATGSIR